VNELKAPRGTFDILPEAARKRQFVEEIAARLFEEYGYRRIITPVFEHTELFTRAIGEATEIVEKEMYSFEDKAGRSLSLRPEATAPVVRAFIEHRMHNLGLPVKLYYMGPMFRYERPQAGRFREFWQLGVEAMGSIDPAIDAEVVLLLVHYLQRLELGELELIINSMGCPECRPSFAEELQKYLFAHLSKFCADCQKRAHANPLRVFDCKRETCRAELREAPLISNYWCETCLAHFEKVQEYLRAAEVEFAIETSLVRGFDYYTRTTFEVRSPLLGAQNALGGGGRYDKLIEDYGGPDTPAIGFAIGTERVLLALDKEGVSLPSKLVTEAFVATVDESARNEGFKLLFDFHRAGISADMDYLGRSLKGQLKLADRLGVSYAVVLGPDEVARGNCQLRDMKTGEQREASLKQVVEEVKSLLELE
jgi:histidyl-tRNA synthetase